MLLTSVTPRWANKVDLGRADTGQEIIRGLTGNCQVSIVRSNIDFLDTVDELPIALSTNDIILTRWVQ